jgi:hypothetical protein
MTFEMYSFYEDDDTVIYCGECINKFLADTAAGLLIGDERVTPDMFNGPLDDDDPLQCDECLKQNKAYEEETNP